MLKKVVNGIEAVCSSEEETEIRAEWTTNAAVNTAKPAPTPEPDARAVLRALVKKNIITEAEARAEIGK